MPVQNEQHEIQSAAQVRRGGHILGMERMFVQNE